MFLLLVSIIASRSLSTPYGQSKHHAIRAKNGGNPLPERFYRIDSTEKRKKATGL